MWMEAGPGRAARKALEELMREPGYVQLVLQKGARQVLPLAVLYDHPLDAGVPSMKSYRLCDTFRTALEQNQPLAECSCFQGNCPSKEDRFVQAVSGDTGITWECHIRSKTVLLRLRKFFIPINPKSP